ncbi:CPBP family intramembrane glutamic endopeptidase [Fodinibius salsisoli]|uniref:CPBP family intramembrane metalloprotease n=1 Tax=Fodinibius salsisoli TaxID=2820877 RepID=A0ABT3PRK0_9BACT|nr:CPBP family intramembrane glutamic endopeptidase [Fodinibius salsisoli]MCW9708490.1 CPBP family intramembrane metalloprotease [Fodinibius salsisoli]
MEKIQPRWYLILEALLLFVGIPLLFYWDLVPIPKIIALLFVTAYCGYQLWKDSSFGRGLLAANKTKEISKSLIVRIPLVAVSLILLIWLFQPDQFFSFPSEQPILWMVVMVLYPVLSALPQEFIYRTFFFHRYDVLILYRNGSIIFSTLAFAFLHIVYDNWWAVGLSLIAGLLFGLTYQRTRSLLWVTVEHVFYGWMIFTLGFGNFFYEPF